MPSEKKVSRDKLKMKGKSSITRRGKLKKFRPFLIPRYLPGSVPQSVLLVDLKIYNEHRYNIFSAIPKVDTAPPKMNPYNYVDATKLADDFRRLQRIDEENKNLLRKINLVNRHGGKVDTFNPKAYDRSASKWYEHESEALRIVRDNKVIYQRILKAHSLNSKKSHDEFWKGMLQKLKFRCKYPLVILDQKNYDAELRQKPSISDLSSDTPAPKRPICFMTFKVDNGMRLGTVFVQLYVDFVPVTCQNFIALCRGDDPNIVYKNSIIHNIAKNKYIELGDITLGNGKGGKTIYGDRFDEENFTLQHNRPGVLSMIPVGNHENTSSFSITLCEMPQFNNKRVVFGKVVKGWKVVTVINDLGKKIGKPNPPVRMVNCGECDKKIIKKLFKETKL